MNDERIARVEQAIAEAEAAGKPWTNESIRAATHSNKSALGAYLKDRRARTAASGAVAVLQPQSPLPSPPAPPLPPAPAPDSPLARARDARDEAVRTEETLAAAHTATKRERQQIEQRLLVLETTKSMCPPAADLARRREERTLNAEHAQAEAERQRVFAHLSQANEKRLAAEDAYREMQEEAGRWLRRMRQRQREARTLPHAWARNDAAEEAQQAAEQLTALVGEQATAALAAAHALQPDWLRG